MPHLPVMRPILKLGIGYLRYAPLDMLDNDTLCEDLLVDGHYQLVFYSLDELACQVRARLRISRFAPNGLKTDA